MEKTIHITIAGTTFQLSEAAYEKLEAYLESLKAHFAKEADKSEIIRDIESRIAEKFLEKKHKMVSEEDVAAVIAEMGDASELGDGTEEPGTESASTSTATTYKKLYRDSDRAIIGGVAAGIAAYFNVDPLFIRLLFVVSIFFGGGGIVLYLLLWLLIPEATTSSQKLEMRGDAVTLENIKDMVKDRVNETKTRGAFARLVYFPFEIAGAIIRFVTQRLAPLFGTLIGILFTVGSFFALIGATIGLGVVFSNWNAPYNDFPLREAASPLLLKSTFIAGYLAIVIPLILIAALGVRLVRRKSTLPSTVGFGLVGVWALSLIASGIFIANLASSYYQHTTTSPNYVQKSETLELAPFARIVTQQGNITIKEGNQQSVVLNGRQMDMENITAVVLDGTLTISRVPQHDTRVCIFCRRSMPNVVITTPNIESLTIGSGTVNFEDFATDRFTFTMEHGHARGSITAKDLTISANSSSLDLAIMSDMLDLSTRHSHANLEGAAQNATLSFEQSSVSGEEFVVQHAKLSTKHSFVELTVPGVLEYVEDRTSSVQIEGQGTDVVASTTPRGALQAPRDAMAPIPPVSE